MPTQAATGRVDAAIASGCYRFRVRAPGVDDADMHLASRSALVLRVRIPALDRIAEVDLTPLFFHFLDSGLHQKTYSDEASITIEKFGSPLQFKETIHVEFSHN